MLKQAYEVLTQLFTIAQRVNKHDEEIREFWRELRANTAVSTRLYYDQARLHDEFQRLAERAADELKHQTEREAEAASCFKHKSKSNCCAQVALYRPLPKPSRSRHFPRRLSQMKSRC